MRLDLRGAAFGDHPSAVQHDDAVAEPHDQRHVVVDHQQADSGLVAKPREIAQELVGFGRVHSGRRLVEQQVARPERQRPRDLEPALGAVVERRRGPVGEIGEAEIAPAIAARRRAGRSRRQDARAARALISTFSSTLSWPKRRMFWKVRPIPARATSWAGHRVASLPSIRMRPALGPKRPEMMLRSVVLPEPFGPISPTISPGRRLEIDAVEGAEAGEILDHAFGAELARRQASPAALVPAAPPAGPNQRRSALRQAPAARRSRRAPIHHEQDQDAKAGLGEPEQFGRLPAEDVDAASARRRISTVRVTATAPKNAPDTVVMPPTISMVSSASVSSK